MGKEKLKADFFPLRFMTSRKEYRCDGCAGEFPILADCLYARTAYKDAQGKAHGMILCIRCACAIGSKQKHTTRPLELAPGGLRFHTLSSAFRRQWQAIEQKAQNGEELGSILSEIGITTSDEEVKRMQEEKNKAKVTRQIHREKRELQDYRKQVAETQKRLGGMLDELATLHLKETLAWTKGDRKAIDAAKTTYGEKVKEIRDVLATLTASEDTKETKK